MLLDDDEDPKLDDWRMEEDNDEDADEEMGNVPVLLLLDEDGILVGGDVMLARQLLTLSCLGPTKISTLISLLVNVDV